MQLTLTATSEDRGVRIDAWLAAHVEGLTRSAAAKLLESGGGAADGGGAGRAAPPPLSTQRWLASSGA